MVKKKRAKKSTFLKDPLESIAVHIGKIFDNANPSQIIDLAINAGLAWVGMDTFGYKPESALVGPIALRLAQSDNIVSGASGVIGLSTIGVARLAPSLLDDLGDKIVDMFDVQPEVDAYMKKNYSAAMWEGVAGYNFHKVESILTACPLIPFKQNITFPVYGGLFRACVATDLGGPGGANGEPPPVDGGNGGVEPPLPPPPLPDPGWERFFTQDRMICTRCMSCGETICAWNEADLRAFMASHIHVPSNGVE